MDRISVLSAVLFVISFTLPAYALEVSKGEAPDAPPAQVKAVRAGIVQYETIVGRVEGVDRTKNTMVIVTDKKVKKTITASPGDMGKIRKGTVLKIELDALTGKAVKISHVKPGAGKTSKKGKK